MRRAIFCAVLCAAACKTHPVMSDAGLAEPPSASVAVSSSPSTSSSVGPPQGNDCAADSDCGPASCCGPFMAEGRCVKTTTRNCEGVMCPQIVSDYACACRRGLCTTTRKN